MQEDSLPPYRCKEPTGMKSSHCIKFNMQYSDLTIHKKHAPYLEPPC